MLMVLLTPKSELKQTQQVKVSLKLAGKHKELRIASSSLAHSAGTRANTHMVENWGNEDGMKEIRLRDNKKDRLSDR